MASFTIPVLREGGTCTVQLDTRTISFRVLISELHSTHVFNPRAKQVEKTQAYFDLAEEQAAYFPRYDENLVFRTSDGRNLL